MYFHQIEGIQFINFSFHPVPDNITNTYLKWRSNKNRNRKSAALFQHFGAKFYEPDTNGYFLSFGVFSWRLQLSTSQ